MLQNYENICITTIYKKVKKRICEHTSTHITNENKSKISR